MNFTRSRRWARRVATAVLVLGFANFLAFLAESAALGGDALSGHAAGGHYYVANSGVFTEVSQAVWTLSRIHAIVTLVSWPLVLISGAFLVFYLVPSSMVGKAPEHASDRVAAIRASAAPLWRQRPGYATAGSNMTVGVFDAAVYPAGIVVKLGFRRPSAVRADEIHSVRFRRRFLASTIEIEHAGLDVTSPLVLYGRRDSAQAVAILSLVSPARHDRA